MKLISLVTAAGVWGKSWPILLAILFFGLLVMSHETGHFLFAKLFKVKVNEFAFGMGPTILSFGKGETKYSWRLFPIGGFCAMEGENEKCEGERAFCNKPAWQRFIIVAAGATVNIITGFIIICLMLTFTTVYEEGIGTREILYFADTAVSNEQLEVGDVITEINGKHVFSMYDISFLMLRDDDGVMDITVNRKGEKVPLKAVKFETADNKGSDGITIVFDFTVHGVDVNFKNVITNACGYTMTMARMVWLTLFDMCTGKYGLNDLSGPIGTVGIVADVASNAVASGYDFEQLLLVAALICINIGLFNLLPLPALDGGRIFFILIEMVFRKPVPQKYESVVHAVGMVLLLAFMALISVSDILKLIRGELY